MKSNKALRFIVLLIAVMAFFMVYASTGDSSSSDGDDETDFSGTYIHEFGGTGRYKAVFSDGAMSYYESMDSGSTYELLDTATYTVSDKKITLSKEVGDCSSFTITSSTTIKSNSNREFTKQ